MSGYLVAAVFAVLLAVAVLLLVPAGEAPAVLAAVAGLLR